MKQVLLPRGQVRHKLAEEATRNLRVSAEVPSTKVFIKLR